VRRVDRLVAKTPINRALRRRAAASLAVLGYHGVDDPDSFSRQLDHLQREYQPLALDELEGFVARNEAPPPRSVLITFDDGHRSVLEVGLPLLRERGLPAVAFVVTGLLDSDHPFWWDEVEQLLAAGGSSDHVVGLSGPEAVKALKRMPDATRLAVIDDLRTTAAGPAARRAHLRSGELAALESGGVAIASHTVTHPMLPACSADKVRHELERSRAQLQQILGRTPSALAYPNGTTDEHVTAAARDAGYELAFLFDHRLNSTPIVEPMRISRVRVNSTTPMARFEGILSGLHPWVHHRVFRRS
jgi:peptidoglycan/xylan/chitin deacetylase (PgdA/CDA1 family)